MSDNKLQFTFGDFKSEPEISGLEDIQFGDFTESLISTDTSIIDKPVVKDEVVEPTKAPAIEVLKKVKAPSRAARSNDLLNIFKKYSIPQEGNALVLEKPKDCTAISETTVEAIDSSIVEKPVKITQPRTDPTPPMKRRSKNKERWYLQADNLYLEVKDYFHWFVKGLRDPDRVPKVNAFRESNIEPWKHPKVFDDKEVLEYFLDCVSRFFRDAKKNHGHRPNFIELDFTYVPANKQSNRPKLLLHKKGYVLER